MTRRVVMLLSNGFSSDPRVEKEAAALAAAGWEVNVLAWDREGSLPAEEQRGAARVLRLGPRARHGGGIRNIGGYREFWREAAARAASLGADVLHCHDLDTAPAGLDALRRLPRAALVLDFHELYRESNMIPQRGVVGLLARAAVRLVERRAIPRADVVLVANPGTVAYHDRFGVRDRLVLVENAPDIDAFAPVCPRDPFTVGFMGQKRYLEGLRALIQAAERTGVHALLAGGGTSEAEVARLAADVPNVEVSGRFRYEELPAMYARCSAVYAVYDARLGNVRTLFPVKVMEAMASALPVIVAEGTWIGDYVRANGIGLTVPVGDVGALVAALERLRDDRSAAAEMGRKGRALVEGGLNWQAASGRLLEAYERLERRPENA